MRTRRTGQAREFGGWPVLHPGRGPARPLVAELPGGVDDLTGAGPPDKYGDRYVAVDG